MELAVNLLLSFAFGCILVVWIVFSVQKKRRKEQEKKVAKQKREELQRVGENIVTTVQVVNGDFISTRGRHPTTGQFLFFTGVREPRHKRYSPSDCLNVLVDLNNPSNYKLQWDTDPLELAKELNRANRRHDQINRNELVPPHRRTNWIDEPLPIYNQRQLPKNRSRFDRDDLLFTNRRAMLDKEPLSLDRKQDRRKKGQWKRVKCMSCHGKGSIPCSLCKGRSYKRIGKLEDKVGKPYSPIKACVICDGQGSFLCQDCKGTGSEFLDLPF